MKCFKCGKEMDGEDGTFTLKGICVDLSLEDKEPEKEGLVLTANLRTPENIAYRNKQIGKYSDGQGECHVAICYECYIDGLFNLSFILPQRVFFNASGLFQQTSR